MKISKLALIALLGGALMAFGCADDDSGGGGEGGGGGGSGGAGGGAGGGGGAAGGGGEGGTGGIISMEGEYTFDCEIDLADQTLTVPVTIRITTAEAEPGFAEGSDTELTTQLAYEVDPLIIELIPVFAPDSMISVVECDIAVTGATPEPITHTAEGLPFTPVGNFDSDTVVTTSQASEGAELVELSISTFSTTITGLGELVPGGEFVLTAGEGDCTDIVAVDGSGPIEFEVALPQ